MAYPMSLAAGMKTAMIWTSAGHLMLRQANGPRQGGKYTSAIHCEIIDRRGSQSKKFYLDPTIQSWLEKWSTNSWSILSRNPIQSHYLSEVVYIHRLGQYVADRLSFADNKVGNSGIPFGGSYSTSAHQAAEYFLKFPTKARWRSNWQYTQ